MLVRCFFMFHHVPVKGEIRMAAPAARKPMSDGPLQVFRRWLWCKFVEWATFEEICEQIGFGEIRIVVHDYKMKDLHIALHLREDR